ncbi:Bifunctional inhibitor/lipid-transfer protein/seed storage 2S albumin protein [Dioscorea alata]|uniref:Bifunctional inhibitor/lipid-transfer protein/seed storage 2S albumin protein n=1 Tax=Dioscorea alata TaxID=55571 RepID=A0ACB7WIF4_DIOAL|nr:Bifunctional inhibitor/lipid-transfer protein/seed storage 2S albumin protein [Dioscorea alata]
MQMASNKTMAMLISLMVLVPTLLFIPPVSACTDCNQQASSHTTFSSPHHHSTSSRRPRRDPPPVVIPPPVVVYPPHNGNGGSGINAPPSMPSDQKCSIDLLKIGLCIDVLGLVHVGLGNPVENVCCPVLQGLLELEAAACLCTAIRLKVLNLNIYIPLALQVLITCGKDPPAGYLCPAL